MAQFRCTKCSHLVQISLYRGLVASEIRHSYCGGKLERISIDKSFGFIATDFQNPPLSGSIYHSKSGAFRLDGTIFVKLI